ncbi:PREDICTED: tRNA 2'-phosphotransferase 1 [Nicrophorus vespilloides]|uniref:2'-phosphotransferase n=1 Tax=Nicrophorus vespilloides TaxID=110193 RepID=A0ABM1NH86_NICVS|nr:PREDICTED: tRNA 2'-phosphotransferase 1 [Nicrophorus vespilloides]XP_017786186.1 PREDICTED: tRNA 2'-phosphotransferase 1 [Nicrophorus vespilloides]
MNPNDIHISKTLSWLLRHAAVKEGFPLQSDGFIKVDDLLKHRQLKKATIDDIKRVVECNDKKRFKLVLSADDVYLIRANQGHSIQAVNNLELTPILTAADAPVVVHGTYYKFWNSIRKTGLNRMNRLHIHFATGIHESVVSGIRKDCELYIYIDLDKSLLDNLTFYLSSNGVVLSPGDADGLILPRYFLRVVDKETGNILKF